MPDSPRRRLHNQAASQPFPAAETIRAREAVADYLTKHGVPNTVPDLRLAVRDAWMEILRVVPSTAHLECADFTVVYQDRTQGGLVFAYHAPTRMVFPAVMGTSPDDTTWLAELSREMTAD